MSALTQVKVYLVAVRNGQPSLWKLGFGGQMDAAFQTVATQAWECAKHVVENHTEWPAFRSIAGPSVQHLSGCQSRGLDGESFGLSFALAIWAQSSGAELPCDFVASATLAEDGILGSVERLDAKIAIAENEPSIQRIFVSSRDKKAAKRRVKRLEVVAVDHLDQVLELLGLKPPVQSAEKGRELLLSLISEALGSGVYRPQEKLKALERAAELLLAQPWLDARDRLVADTCLRASQRHADIEHGAPPVIEMGPLEEALAQVPQPLRAVLLSHLLRESFDNGAPSFEQLRPLVATRVRTGLDAFPAEIQMASSYSQCLWMAGEVTEAFELGRACIAAWQVRQTPQKASYALTHIFQCAWLEPRLLPEAERIYQAHSVFDPNGSLFYDLARARAYGLQDAQKGIELLKEMRERAASSAPYLRMSWQRLARQFGMDVPMERPEEPLKVQAAFLKLDQIRKSLVDGQDAEQEARGYFLESPGVRQAILLNQYHQPQQFAPFILKAFPY